MNKGLESLEKLKQYWDNKIPLSRSGGLKIVSNIEKELKRLEELEKAFDALSKEDEKAKKLLSKEIEKNRALEIIKRKPKLDLIYIRYTEDYNDYVMTLNIASYGLENEDVLIYATEKEYELLKEVLL